MLAKVEILARGFQILSVGVWNGVGWQLWRVEIGTTVAGMLGAGCHQSVLIQPLSLISPSCCYSATLLSPGSVLRAGGMGHEHPPYLHSGGAIDRGAYRQRGSLGRTHHSPGDALGPGALGELEEEAGQGGFSGTR